MFIAVLTKIETCAFFTQYVIIAVPSWIKPVIVKQHKNQNGYYQENTFTI